MSNLRVTSVIDSSRIRRSYTTKEFLLLFLLYSFSREDRFHLPPHLLPELNPFRIECLDHSLDKSRRLLKSCTGNGPSESNFLTSKAQTPILKIMKTLHCRDAGFDCDAVVKATTDEEVLNQAAEHAHAVHGVTVTPELAAGIKSLIREEPA